MRARSPSSPGVVVTIEVDGVQREARVHVPVVETDAPRPLVIAFHGYGGGFWDLESAAGLSDAADAHGFVVAYPQGVGEGPTWDLQGDSDTAFVIALIDELVASQCIDPTRVFATGFSMGGGMTNVLACRLADRFAAVAPVAANHGETWGGTCAPSRPVPIMAFHGTLDTFLPYEGGDSPFPDRPVTGVEDWMAEWADCRRLCSGPDGGLGERRGRLAHVAGLRRSRRAVPRAGRRSHLAGRRQRPQLWCHDR